ncbi:MAG: hypothetical protein AB1486_14245 [Planctomycetota bacterium]
MSGKSLPVLVGLVAANITAKECGVEAGLVNLLTFLLASAIVISHALLRYVGPTRAERLQCVGSVTAGSVLAFSGIIVYLADQAAHWIRFALLVALAAWGGAVIVLSKRRIERTEPANEVPPVSGTSSRVS